MTKKKSEESPEGEVTEKTEEKENKPTWVKISAKEIEKIVVELAEKGETPSKIGMVLRDKHGVPKAKIEGKKVTKILDEKGIKYKTEKDMIQKNIDVLKVHVEKNKKDHSASRALTKKLWALRRTG